MKKSMSLMLALAMVLCLLSGCGSQPKSVADVDSAAGVQRSSVSEDEDDPAEKEPVEETYSEVSEIIAEEKAPSPMNGIVIPAEECQANGYDVTYGMFDFETYIDLPLIEDGDTLSYWFMLQPFMMGYNNYTPEDFTYFKEMEARTGVHLDLIPVSMFSVSEQFSLMVTSGDYSDMIEGATAYYSGGATKAIEDGFLADMTEYLDEMPNYVAWLDSDPSYRKDVVTLDGGMAYAACFTEVERNVGPQFRGDWLDKLGLDVPTTYDEYHDVLKAFKDAYGAGIWLDSYGAQRNNVLSAGFNVHSNNSDPTVKPFRVVDGVVEYSPYTDDYHDFMRMLAAWWSEGLIYQDFLSQQSVSTPDNSLVLNGVVGAWATDNNTMTTYDSLSDEIDIRPAPLPRQEAGQTLHLYAQSGKCGDGTSISTTCSDPILAAHWLDYNYTYEGTLLCGYGVEGEGLTFDEEGKPMYTDLVLNNPDMITVACSLLYSKYGGAGVIDAYRYTPGYTEKQRNATELWLENLDTECEFPNAVQFKVEESTEYSTIMSDLNTYATQSTLKFITGELSVEDDWDAYIANLESLGVVRVQEICQIAYDRYSLA